MINHTLYDVTARLAESVLILYIFLEDDRIRIALKSCCVNVLCPLFSKLGITNAKHFFDQFSQFLI